MLPTNHTLSNRPVEMGWFAPCCEEDAEFLGVADPALASTPPHLRDVILSAETAGFQNILLPSGFNTGVDAWTMAAYVAREMETLSLLPAVRVGEAHPPMFARAAANLDQMLGGKLNVNIISSPLAGLPLESSAIRYKRTREFMQIIKLLWRTPQGEVVNFAGDFYHIADLKRDLPEPTRPNGPPLYFGGSSPGAKDAAACSADVYLFWGDTTDFIQSGIAEMRERAHAYNRSLLYGLRVHVIARATEREALDAAVRLVSRLTDATGDAIRQRSQDKNSVGRARQNALREQGDWVDKYLWTGVGRGRAGCGTAIVGSYDQVEQKLRDYMALGIDAFILSGYPHQEEAERFGKHLLPRFVPTTCADLLAAPS